MLVDFYADNMQYCQSCDEDLRQQAALATPVWKMQVGGIWLINSQVVVLIVEANNKMFRIGLV